jgi:hypothetical protein
LTELKIILLEPSKTIPALPLNEVALYVGLALPEAVAFLVFPLLSFHWLTSDDEDVMVLASAASSHRFVAI